jgi:proline dehydrogenase
LGLLQDMTYRAAKRWIAGKDMKAALSKAREANAKGLGAVLNYLGEDVKDPRVAESHFQEYVSLQRAIAMAGIDGCVSVKLTQFGLGVMEDSAVLEKARRLAEDAQRMKRMLWIDMESSSVTTRTLQIYSDLLEAHKNVGVALQAYLRRSEADLHRLMDIGAKVRLVKGAYREPREAAFRSREEVTESYIRLMRVLFERGEGFAIGTHDSRPIEEAQRLHQSNPDKQFEFEMLRGIRDDLKLRLAKAGHRVVDYMPYGEEWYPYSIRRIKEHPSNIWLLLRSI